MKRLYRYDGCGDLIHISEFIVIKKTECGYWVKQVNTYSSEKEKWVSKTGKKRLCYPTKKEALKNLYHRRLIYVGLLKRHIENSNTILNKIKVEMGKI